MGNAIATAVVENADQKELQGSATITPKNGDPILIDGKLTLGELQLHLSFNEDVLKIAQDAYKAAQNLKEDNAKHLQNLNTILGLDPEDPATISKLKIGGLPAINDIAIWRRNNNDYETPDTIIVGDKIQEIINENEMKIADIEAQYDVDLMLELQHVENEFVEICQVLVDQPSLRARTKEAIDRQEDAYQDIERILAGTPLGAFIEDNELNKAKISNIAKRSSELIDDDYDKALEVFKYDITQVLGKNWKHVLPTDDSFDVADYMNAFTQLHRAIEKADDAQEDIPQQFQQYLQIKSGRNVTTTREWWKNFVNQAVNFLLIELVATGVLIFVTGGAAGVAKAVTSVAKIVKNSKTLVTKLASRDTRATVLKYMAAEISFALVPEAQLALLTAHGLVALVRLSGRIVVSVGKGIGKRRPRNLVPNCSTGKCVFGLAANKAPI